MNECIEIYITCPDRYYDILEFSKTPQSKTEDDIHFIRWQMFQ